MVRRALGFLARTGPSSAQDRWEENAGISVFTLSVCIAALVAGAPFLGPPDKRFALTLADFWNASIESWTSIGGTPLAERLGVEAYYVRVAPADVVSDRSALRRSVEIKNGEPGRTVPADEEVSVDFLQLVRLGLRLAEDPVVRASVTVADALLRVDTPRGPAWHRYNGDGYGEHDDGRPFDGTGRGRAWPLLTGERGHYALARGEDPMPYLQAMAAMTGPGGMMPEQVWDAAALPEARLFPGLPTGSAMPLAWAHAEFIKLMVSRHLGHPVDRPAAVWRRYGGRPPEANSRGLVPACGCRTNSARQLPAHRTAAERAGALERRWLAEHLGRRHGTDRARTARASSWTPRRSAKRTDRFHLSLVRHRRWAGADYRVASRP